MNDLQNVTVAQNAGDPAESVEASVAVTAGNPATGKPDTTVSAELLRITLPKMSKHGHGFAPMSYAIWYEYVRGENAALRMAIDSILPADGRITEEQTNEIYRLHVVSRLEAAVMASRIELLQLLGDVDDTVDQASTSTSQFGEKLEVFAGEMTADVSVEQIQATVAELRKDTNGVSSALALLHDQLEASRSEAQRLADELATAKEQAQLDPLSGLLNRRGFDQALERLIADANADNNATPLSIFVIDIDHFKKVNDTYGHLVGDEVIRAIAKVLDGGVMRKDLVARIGGEEFAILLPQTDARGGVAMAERIRQTVINTGVRVRTSKAPAQTKDKLGEALKTAGIKPSPADEKILHSSISGGVAEWIPGESALELIGRADRALYEAKNSGRNRICEAQ